MSGRKSLLIVVALVAALTSAMAGIAKSGQAEPKAKYVFLFIGDGMGIAQRYAAELYASGNKAPAGPERAKLLMNSFPAQGLTTTNNLTSLIPDSASTATAIATGHKTASGIIGMDESGKVSYENIAETARNNRWKVGILSSASLDSATPAAFYAHVKNRRQTHDICLQLARCGFDYFAGGQFLAQRDGNDPGRPDAIDTARQNGYTIAQGRAEVLSVKPGSGKVIAMSETVDRDAAMHFTIDRHLAEKQVTLAEFLSKGIELLENPEGFFIMVEGGKIDWACHANDAASSIHEVLALDEAVGRAYSFYEKHPAETLIVVTADHETGGMSLGFAGTRSSLSIEMLRSRQMSYSEFDRKLEEYRKTRSPADSSLEDLMPLLKDAFGLYVPPSGEKSALENQAAQGRAEDATDEMKKAGREAELKLQYSLALNDRELAILQDAFRQSMLGEKERSRDAGTYLLYGSREPLSIKLTTILDNKAGLAWTTYSHTAAPVQTSAVGVGAQSFNGYYDQTDIYTKLMAVTGLKSVR